MPQGEEWGEGKQSNKVKKLKEKKTSVVVAVVWTEVKS
jgi:hypothetical protein